MIHSIQVYTVSGHLSIITGSREEAQLIADMLKGHRDIYKLKILEPPKALENTKLDLSGGKVVWEWY